MNRKEAVGRISIEMQIDLKGLLCLVPWKNLIMDSNMEETS